MKYSIGILFISIASINLYIHTTPKKYIFHQQLNDMCMIAPMLNLPLVEKLEKNNYDTKKLPAYTRKEWFVLNQKPLQAWHAPFQALNKETRSYNSNPKYAPLVSYLNNAIEKGPLLPHFYTAQGTFAFSGITGAAHLALMPYCLIDYAALEGKNIKLWNLCSIYDLGRERPMLGLKIPLVQENQNYKIYYEKNDTIQQTTLGSPVHQMLNGYNLLPGHLYPIKTLCELSTDYSPKAYELLSTIMHNTLDINIKQDGNDVYLWHLDTPQLGLKKIGLRFDLAQGYEKKYMFSRTKTYIPYMQGLYKMMLLQLGLGINNKENHYVGEEKEVISTLNKLIEEHRNNNPWRPELLSKDNFLQYEIACILQAPENEALLKKVQQTIDFYFTPWQLFNDVKYNKKYYNINKKPYLEEDVKYYMPGDTQALAYMITQALRLLFYGACSPNAKAFYKATGAPCIPYLFSFDQFKKAAFSKKYPKTMSSYPASLLNYLSWRYWTTKPSPSFSFIDVWQELRTALFERWKTNKITRKHWISFDGHGWVISFDKKPIDMQKNIPGTDKELLNTLGFTGIESWLGSELETFYKLP